MGEIFQVDLVIFTLVWWRTTLVPTIWPSTSVRPGSSSRRVKTALQRESTPSPFLPSDISDNYLCCCRLWIERTEPAPSSSQSPPHLFFFCFVFFCWDGTYQLRKASHQQQSPLSLKSPHIKPGFHLATGGGLPAEQLVVLLAHLHQHAVIFNHHRHQYPSSSSSS